MIRAESFIDKLRSKGFQVFSGVPCSYLTPFINTVIDSPDVDYIGAANEAEAVAIACGAELGGKRAVVLFQNSGLGNAVNPLTSLTTPFGIPILIIVTWRAQPGGAADEPQHHRMGHITPTLLETLEIPWEVFPTEEDSLSEALARATTHMREKRAPYAFIMQKGTVHPHELQTRHDLERDTVLENPLPARQSTLRHATDDVLKCVQEQSSPRDAIVATTGFIGRALYGQGDRDNQLYMVGSMGCVSTFGLGLAKVRPERRVITLDGDGAALMHLGAMATVGAVGPKNLLHVVLDNGVHESTGGQATVTPQVDLCSIAQSCGYSKVLRLSHLSELANLLQEETQELTFVHIRTAVREVRKLPRPTVSPMEVFDRFRSFLDSTQ